MGAKGKRLLEIAIGGGVGAGIGAMNADSKSEMLGSAMEGAGYGAGLSFGASHLMRGSRARSLMKKGPRTVFANAETKQYMRKLTNETKLKSNDAVELMRYMPNGRGTLTNLGLPKGYDGKKAVAYMEDVGLRAHSYGEARAMQDAYGQMKQVLIDNGVDEHVAAVNTAKAIFDGRGVQPAVQELADATLNSKRFAQMRQVSAQKFLAGKVKPEQINNEIIDYTRKSNVLATLSPKDKHLENPTVFRDIRAVVEKLRQPKIRKGIEFEAGGETVKAFLDDTLWGFGKV